MIINRYSGIQFNNSGINTDSAVNPSGNVSDNSASEGNAGSILSGLDTVTGKIMEVSDGQVRISLGGDNVITARIDSPLNLTTGSTITFSVKNSDSQTPVLTPLLTNTDTTYTASKALINAGLTMNLRNSDMVSAMMQQGLGISREELTAMSRALAGVDDGNIASAVKLTSLGIEPTEDNIVQFTAYENYEHQVSDAVNDICDLIPDAMNTMTQNGSTSEALGLARDLLDIFTGKGAMEPINDSTGTLSGMDEPIVNVLEGSELSELAGILEEYGAESELIQSISEGNISFSDTLQVLDYIVNSEAPAREAAAAQTIPGDTAAADPASVLNPADMVTADNPSESSGPLTGGIGDNFLSSLKENLTDPTLRQTISTISENVQNGRTEALSRLVSSKAFQSLVKNAVSDEWKLTPKQVGEDKEVSGLYRRMTEQTQRLLNVLNSHSAEDSPLAKETVKLSQNINFMNELNNMFNYVQLPMKMSGSDAHGELYVYSNKKHMASDDGTVSALLHLDMDNLGPTDIYVSMNSSNHVNTHFYLPDEESLDLVEAHIDELTARIEKRGYSVSSEFTLSDEKTNVIEKISASGDVPKAISVSGFDARA